MRDAPRQSDDSPSGKQQDPLVQRPTPNSASQSRGLRIRFGTKALVRSGGRVLLVRERRANGSTFWTLPGGGLEPGETVRESLVRELREEIACECSVGAIVDRCPYHHSTRPDTMTLYTVFETTLHGQPTPNTDQGVIDCRWSDPTAPPEDTLTPFERLLAGTVR